MGINRVYTQTMDIDPPVYMLQQESADPYHIDDIQQETRLLQSIDTAQTNPLFEDKQGRNGFHCLAAATLSSPSVTQKYGLDENGLPNSQKRRKDKASKYSDSSADKLEFRRILLQNLIVAGVDPNHYDLQGNKPLMAFAAQLPEDDDHIIGLKIIKELIEAGANVDARNRAGETALHVAVRCGHKLAVKQLVNSGANVHARDAAGRSVLEVTDVKMRSLRGQDEAEYAHLEACRAWLSGTLGGAVQEPTVMQEWGVRTTGQN
jgi:ankyrin repeat protein